MMRSHKIYCPKTTAKDCRRQKAGEQIMKIAYSRYCEALNQEAEARQISHTVTQPVLAENRPPPPQ
jgi:hypothetical protein